MRGDLIILAFSADHSAFLRTDNRAGNMKVGRLVGRLLLIQSCRQRG